MTADSLVVVVASSEQAAEQEPVGIPHAEFIKPDCGNESESESPTVTTMDDTADDNHDDDSSCTLTVDPPKDDAAKTEPDATVTKNVTTTEPIYEERTNVTLQDHRGCEGVYSGRVLWMAKEDEDDSKKTCVPDGYGTMKYNTDNNNNNNTLLASSYTGHWKLGAWHGQGQATLWPNDEDTYSGEHVAGERHGTGTYHWADGRIYTGSFWKNQRHGQGSYKWPGGATYEGAYHQGVRTGYGRYIDAGNGISYVGDWKAGKYHGYGVLTTTTLTEKDETTTTTLSSVDLPKRVYRGNFEDGQPHGHGVEVNADGTIWYDGEWNQGEPCYENTPLTTPPQKKQPPKQESEFLVVENESVQDANGLKGVYRGILHRASRLPHGNGTLTYKNTTTVASNDDEEDALDYYEGCFDMGRYHGRGRLYWKNGDSYDGDYVEGRRQGQGVYRWGDGRHYKGAFHNDLRHGFGKFVYGEHAADWYEGDFVKGRREGKGRFVFADGSVYTGDWKEGLYHGEGELVSSSGSSNMNNDSGAKTYQGTFDRGLAHGWGKEMGPDGAVLYEGNWIGGDPEAEAKRKAEAAQERLAAQATLRQPRRDRESTTARGGPPEPDCEAVVDMEVMDAERNFGQYTGLVLSQNKKPHGVGRMVYLDGRRIHEGFWKNGMKEGHGRCLFVEQGDFHEGEYKNNVRHGPGKYKWKDGRIFSGHYFNDLRHGQGTFTYPNGEMYEGNFTRGEKHGFGRFEFRGGFYEGQWEESRYHGRGRLSVRGDVLDGIFRDGEFAGKADGYHAETNAGKSTGNEDGIASVDLTE